MKCKLYSKDYLERQTPSRKDGLEYKKEQRFTKSCYNYIKETGQKLGMPQLTVATATVFFHRFFAARSMLRTDRWLLATAAMFLAGKVEETPKSLKDVIYFFFQHRFRKDKELLSKFYDKAVYEEVKEVVLLLERLLLCVLGFDFNVQHPYPALLRTWRDHQQLFELHERRLAETKGQKNLVQLSWNVVNDSLSTNVCLQFEPAHIAIAAIHTVLALTGEKLELEDGKPWWAPVECGAGLTPERLESIRNCLLSQYQVRGGGGKGDEATADTTAPSMANSTSDAAATTEPPAKRSRLGGEPSGSGDCQSVAAEAAGEATAEQPQRSAVQRSSKGPLPKHGSTNCIMTASTDNVVIAASPAGSLEEGELEEGEVPS